MSVARLRWIAVVALAAAGVGCEDSKAPSEREAAPAASPAATPAAEAAPTAAATAKEAPSGDSRHEVAGFTVAIPNAWKQTSDKPSEQRFEDSGGKGAMPPACSLEVRALPAGQTDPLVLEEADNPTVQDHATTPMKVAGKSAMDHHFAVEPPGGAPMRIWVRLVDLGGGKRLVLQCLSDAAQFDSLKDSAFTKIFESLQQKEG